MVAHRLGVEEAMTLLSGVAEGVPYSLSRWTDVPASKWPWFEACLEARQMVAFDPRSAAPRVWSLRPEDTLGLVFWTKNPKNLLEHRKMLEPYRVSVHVTATGWEEVEKGAPSIDEAGKLLVRTARVFGKTYWRFSPIPILPDKDLLSRFQRLLGYASIAALNRVFVSFLQPNDRIPETREPAERFALLNQLTDEARAFGVKVILCKDDKSLSSFRRAHFSVGPCVNPVDFGGQKRVHSENCGCALMVDPFTINEACHFGCAYCYAADRTLSERKRNTTRLSIVT